MTNSRVIVGDCREVLRTLPEGSCHCCVTSPPYWNLRDYGVDGQLGLEPTPEEYIATMVDVFREVRRVLRDDGTCWVNMGSSFCSASQQADSHGTGGRASRDCPDDGCPVIHLCDACRGAIFARTGCTDVRLALVSDVGEGVPILAHTESRVLCLGSSGSVDRIPSELSNLSTHDRTQIEARVLSLLGVALGSTTLESWRPPPGECWHCANCGACLSVLRSSSRDARLCGRMKVAPSVSGSARLVLPVSLGELCSSRGNDGIVGASGVRNADTASVGCSYPSIGIAPLKVKDLVNMPFYLAEALRADGWWLRSDIIWAKNNPMPESCTDRPTKAHEYLFLLTKAPNYFYDADAIRERTGNEATPEVYATALGQDRLGDRSDDLGKGNSQVKREGCTPLTHPLGCNKRSVWTIPTQPFAKAHFATFPEKLVEPCIKAGTSDKGCCPECKASWTRVVEKDRVPTRPARHNVWDPTGKANRDEQRHVTEVRTTGWEAGCEHKGTFRHLRVPLVLIPCTVLDPFCGSGTTGVVAKKLGRDFIGIELSEKYAERARRRIANPNPEPAVPDVPDQMALFDDG